MFRYYIWNFFFGGGEGGRFLLDGFCVIHLSAFDTPKNAVLYNLFIFSSGFRVAGNYFSFVFFFCMYVLYNIDI